MRGRCLLDPLVQIRNASEQNSDDLHSHFHSCTLGLDHRPNRESRNVRDWNLDVFDLQYSRNCLLAAKRNDGRDTPRIGARQWYRIFETAQEGSQSVGSRVSQCDRNLELEFMTSFAGRGTNCGSCVASLTAKEEGK